MAVYLQPNKKEELLNTIKWYIKSFRDIGYKIVLTGDFNFREEELLPTINQLGLKIARGAIATR